MRLTKSPRFPQLHALGGVYPSPNLHEGQPVVVNGWALSDRPVGRKMTFIADTGDAALCSVEDLVLNHAAKLGWYVGGRHGAPGDAIGLAPYSLAVFVERTTSGLIRPLCPLSSLGEALTAKGAYLQRSLACSCGT